MQQNIIYWLKSYGIEFPPLISLIAVLALILLTAIILHLFLHNIVLKRWIGKGKNSSHLWVKIITGESLFGRLAFVLQGIVVNIQAVVWLVPNSDASNTLILCAQLWIMLYSLLSLFALLDTLLHLSQQLSIGRHLPLRGLFQSLKLIAAVIIGILIVSRLLGQSPIILISSLGAMAAVLMLIFKDPILGLVAGIQLAANNMLTIGDWLEMPKYGADGNVIDVGLTTVKVQNWDNTITTIPTYALVSDSFKNWQAMSTSGGRRIKRSFNIDTSSIHFISEETHQSLIKSTLLKSYFNSKQQEIAQANDGADLSTPLNYRRLTNLGTFRAYLEAYLKAHPRIRKDMTLMVRHLDPTDEGLPFEIYAFTNTTVWLEYEGIQSDIFDHAFSIIKEFGLRIHQSPTGYDMRSIGRKMYDKPHNE